MTKKERDDLVVQNLPYARSLSLGFSGKHDLDHIEAESAAVNGLMVAAQQFDPAAGARFRTYATHKMFGYMRHALDTAIRYSGTEIQPWHSTYEPTLSAEDRIDAGRILDALEDEEGKEVLLRSAVGERHSDIARDKGVYPSTIKRRADRAKNEALRRIN